MNIFIFIIIILQKYYHFFHHFLTFFKEKSTFLSIFTTTKWWSFDHHFPPSLVMRLFLQKMHNIWIQIFQLNFKFSSASFKTNNTFCYLAFKLWGFFLQRVAQKCTRRRLALAQVWLIISYSRIGLPNQIFNISVCIILSFTKFDCWAIVCFV